MRSVLISLSSAFLFSACVLLQQGPTAPRPKAEPSQSPPGSPGVYHDSPIAIPVGKTTIPFTVNTGSVRAINTRILGFNTGFMFGGDIETLPEVQRLHHSIAPATLRFPGGTIANYYHPDAPGYGFRESEMGFMKDFQGYLRIQPMEKANYLEAFATICKLTNTRVMYVANLLTGTIEENIRTIDRLLAHGLTIEGIELGNEFLLQRYRGSYPSVQVYIDQAKTFAQAFRKKYPNIPLAVVGSGEGEATGSEMARFTNAWNEALSKENFYDAVVYHFYARTGVCNNLGDQGKSLKEVFDCLLETTAIEHYNILEVVLNSLSNFYGKDRKIWITEWNTAESPKYVGNTFIQAAMAAEFIFNTIRYNSANNDRIEHTHFHNYTGAGFANTLFSLNSQQLPTLNGDPVIGTNCSYYTFAFFKDILLDAKASSVPVNFSYSGGLSNKVFNMQAFLGKDKHLYIYFVNKSGQNVQLSHSDFQQAAVMKMLQGSNLYSTTGQTGFFRKRPAEINFVQYHEDTNTELFIPAYSLGYFKVAL